MAEAVAIAALVVGTYSAKESRDARKEGAKKEEEGQAIAAARDTQQDAVNRRREIRKRNITIAKMQQQSQNSGTSGSSGVSVGSSASRTEQGANFAFQANQADFNAAITSKLQKAANYQGRAQDLQNLSGTAFDVAKLSVTEFDAFK